MQPSEFSPAAPGRVVKVHTGFWAYVPNPLPPPLDSTWQLAGLARTLPNPHLLIRPFVRREAVLSSRIEGTEASLSDLFFFEAASAPAQAAGDVLEVANYVKALEYGLTRLADLPVSPRLLREMHERLMTDVRGRHLAPAEFRRSQNWIGPPGCSLAEATYVPPPPDLMDATLADLERYIHARSDLPPLVRLALIHYQFEAIHPFLDGNGRIGRLLITLLLAVWGLLPQPVLYLSAFFERHRSEYYDRLLAVSRRAEWEVWIEYFLAGVCSQAQDARDRSRRLLDLRETYAVGTRLGASLATRRRAVCRPCCHHPTGGRRARRIAPCRTVERMFLHVAERHLTNHLFRIAFYAVGVSY
jgi:Fic family protein